MKDAKQYKFEDKWSAEIAQYNFTQVPNLLLNCQGHLKLTDGELLTLIHLLTYWYGDEKRIFPSIETLTCFSHKSYPTIQKRLRMLERKGFIKRHHRFGTSNRYDVVPCISRLYHHQNICKQPPRKSSDYVTKMMSSIPSIIIKKEDQGLTRPILNNTNNTANDFSEIMNNPFITSITEEITVIE